jgi:tetratricopeptide (TPR) repeat protein
MFLHRFTVILLGFGLLSTFAWAQTSAWEEKNRAGEKAFQAGKLADAQELFSAALREAQQFGPKDVRQAPILNNLALVAFVQNNFTTAEEDFDQAVSVIEVGRGPEDLLLLPIFDNITRLYVKQWAFDKAIRTSWRSCHIREKKLGVEHADTAANLNQLATLYFDSVRLLPHEQGESTEPGDDATSVGSEIQDDSAKLSMAESLYQRVLAANEHRFGADSVRLVDVIESLARVSRAEGNRATAEQFYQRAVSILETSFGPEELRLAEPLHQMAELKTEDGNYPEADKLYQRAEHITEQKLGPKDASLGPILTGYAALLDRMQKPEQAKELTARASTLPPVRTVSAPAINQNFLLTPYVLLFERAVFDLYSVLH